MGQAKDAEKAEILGLYFLEYKFALGTNLDMATIILK